MNMDISIPACECRFSDGNISFQSVVEYQPETNMTLTKVDYYLVSPDDGAEVLFYSHEVPQESRQDALVINVSGNKNATSLVDIINRNGAIAYTLLAKPTVRNSTEWDGSVAATTRQIQFTDITPSIDVLRVTQNEDGDVTVLVSARYWNDGCFQLFLNLNEGRDNYPFEFIYSEYGYWNGTVTVSTAGLGCNAPVTLTLNGRYSPDCEPLPCQGWSYSKQLDDEVTGACMNTHYQTGLHIFNDTTGDDLSCSVINSDKTGHLIASYTAVRTGALKSVYLRVMSATGALTQPIIAADVTDNNQKDADLAAVEGTDDFVAVWSSNAVGNKYRIYARRFTVSESGKLTATTASIQISQSNGDYVAPRIVYHKDANGKGVFFITWISVADKSIQCMFRNDDDELTEAGYQGETAGAGVIDATYYANSNLDIHNHASLSIALFSAGDKIIAAYKRSTSAISLFEYAFKAGSVPTPTTLPNYEVENIGLFSMAYDDVNSKLKIAFVTTATNSPVYGDTISYFGRDIVRASPVQLNQTAGRCDRPFIKRTPKTAAGKRNFVVAWDDVDRYSTGVVGTEYNTFDAEYSQLASEEAIDNVGKTTKKARTVVTDNQIAIIVEATKMGTQTLASTGLLYYVVNRS